MDDVKDFSFYICTCLLCLNILSCRHFIYRKTIDKKYTVTDSTKVRQPEQLVIKLPKKIFIPAEGFIDYKRFVVPTSFEEERWIKNVKFFLKPKVIHHLAVYIMDSSYIKRENIFDYHLRAISLFGTINNQMYDIEKLSKKKAGIRLPRKAKLVLEIHYEPIGQSVIDAETEVRISFYKTKPEYEIETRVLYAKYINIPPMISNYKVETSLKIHSKKLLVSLRPHMHLRGKASAIYLKKSTEKKEERIFGIDPFRVSFETFYILQNPISIPAGSVLRCVNWFDNSANNLQNPNPKMYVREGFFIKNYEMSNCWFYFLVPVKKTYKKQQLGPWFNIVPPIN